MCPVMKDFDVVHTPIKGVESAHRALRGAIDAGAYSIFIEVETFPFPVGTTSQFKGFRFRIPDAKGFEATVKKLLENPSKDYHVNLFRYLFSEGVSFRFSYKRGRALMHAEYVFRCCVLFLLANAVELVIENPGEDFE